MKLKNKLGLAGLLLGLGLSAGCSSQITTWESKKVEMEVSKPKRVNGECLRYNGIVCENTFSMSGCGETAVNIYYPTSVEGFELDGHVPFWLEEISPEKITLSYFGKKE